MRPTVQICVEMKNDLTVRGRGYVLEAASAIRSERSTAMKGILSVRHAVRPAETVSEELFEQDPATDCNLDRFDDGMLAFSPFHGRLRIAG
jgi:hypothetical protein